MRTLSIILGTIVVAAALLLGVQTPARASGPLDCSTYTPDQARPQLVISEHMTRSQLATSEQTVQVRAWAIGDTGYVLSDTLSMTGTLVVPAGVDFVQVTPYSGTFSLCPLAYTSALPVVSAP